MAVDSALNHQQPTQGADYRMDMAFLVDRLESLVNAGRRVPFGRVLLDEQEVLEIIDQMRITLPNEINQARRIIDERAKIIGTAQSEADQIITMARDRAEYMLDDNGLLLEAKAHAEQMLGDARSECETMKREADNYIAEKLTNLEDILDKDLAQVRRGLEQLR